MIIRDHTADRVLLDELEDLIPDLAHVGHCHFRHTNVPMPMHEHPEIMEFTYLQSGQLRYVADRRVTLVNTGEMIVTWPDEVHCHPDPQARMKFVWLGVRLRPRARTFLGLTGPELCHLRQTLLDLPRRHFPGDPELAGIMHRLCAAFFSRSPFRVTRMRNAVVDFLIRVVELSCTRPVVNRSPAIQSSLDLIENRLTTNARLADLAGEVGLKPSTFKRLFKQQVGIAPHDYLLRRKMQRAKEWLATTDRPITNIAFDLGFSSSQHFGATFHRLVLTSPRVYRCRTRLNGAMTWRSS